MRRSLHILIIPFRLKIRFVLLALLNLLHRNTNPSQIDNCNVPTNWSDSDVSLISGAKVLTLFDFISVQTPPGGDW